MTEYGSVTFTGGSGTKYKFTSYSWDTSFNTVGAAYVIAYRKQGTDGGYSHIRVYIGQTGDLSERFDSTTKHLAFQNITLIVFAFLWKMMNKNALKLNQTS
jgi:hypothetical protein